MSAVEHEDSVAMLTAIQSTLVTHRQGTAGLMAYALEALERARVVGVLDAWAERNEGFSFKTDLQPHDCNTDEPWLCGPSPLGKHRKLARRGETADSARAAAAKAIESGEV